MAIVNAQHATDIDTSAAAVHVRNVSLTYPARKRQPQRIALRDVDLLVPRRQSVALLGPNGSGKSTLMAIICGLRQADTGQVSVLGCEHAAERRRGLGVVFQNLSLDRHLTVRENLRDQAALYGLTGTSAAKTINDALQRAALHDRAEDLVKMLSMGLARRVDLCRALLHQPPVLLLDEPTVGLDPTAREAFLALIQQERNRRELTVLMSTHLMDEADRLDRVVLMHEGSIVADDSPAKLRSELGTRLITVHDPTWQPPAESAQHWQQRSGTWSMHLRDHADDASAILTELVRTGVACSIAPPTLADVFEHHTGATLGLQAGTQ